MTCWDYLPDPGFEYPPDPVPFFNYDDGDDDKGDGADNGVNNSISGLLRYFFFGLSFMLLSFSKILAKGLFLIIILWLFNLLLKC